MITFKTPEEIKILVKGGRILSEILHQVAKKVRPGISALELDKFASYLIRKRGGKPSFLNYQPDFAIRPFPYSLCVSVNEVVVHGLPKENLIFKEGDIVSLDLGMEFKNLFTDMALTVGVGRIDPLYAKMIQVCRSALDKGIKMAVAGNTLGDIGYAIENYVESQGFAVIKDLVGHGVGYKQHEDPLVPNFGQPGKGLVLKRGMVLALEPMITLQNGAVKENPDGSFSTVNKNVAVHFEKTIAVGEKRVQIITP